MFKKLFGITIPGIFLLFFSQSTLSDICGNTTSNSGASYSLEWSTVSLGTGLGATGISTFDSDTDGRPEILFGTGAGFGGNSSFAVIEYDDARSDYVVLCQSSSYTNGITKIVSFHNDTIAHGSLVAFGDGSIEVFDHALGFRAQSIITSASSINDMVVADIDNDGSLEIAVLSATDIALYDANTYSFEQAIPYGGQAFAAGQFTDNVNTELAINTGYVLEVVGITTSILWNYTSIGFSNFFLKGGDIDNDGLDEIVAADSWYNLRTFNADIQGILWEHSPSHDIDAVGVYDSTGDGIPEVIYGDGQWGAVTALNGSNGAVLWSVSNPEHGVTDVLVGNFDNDANLEVLWGAGYSSTGPDYLFIHDLTTDLREWQSGEQSGPYPGVAYGNIDGDNIPDRVYASFESESGYGDGIVTAISGATNEVLWQTTSNTFGGFAWTGLHDVVVADIDGDAVNEVIVGTDELYDGIVYVLNPADGSVRSSVMLEDGSPIYSVKVVDIDGDGDMEILAGGGKEHTGSNGVYVYVIDGPTLTWVSTFPTLGNNWTDLWTIEPVDIDNDGTTEIVALWDNVYIIDPDNNGLIATLNAYHSVASTVDVFTGDSVVYLGSASGGLEVLGADGSTTAVANICDNMVSSLVAISPVKLAFTCGGQLGTYDIVGSTVEWQTSTVVDANLGINDRIAFQNISGVNTLFVGGNRAYYFVEGSPSGGSAPIAHDGSFEGHFNQTIQGVLNAEDPNSLALTFGIYQQPASGNIEITNSSTGEFIYTPAGNYSGIDEFQFYVSNGSAASNLATVTLSLTNTAPVGLSASHDVHWNALFLGSLDGSDANNDLIRFEIVSNPGNGVLVLLDEYTGEFSYYNTSPVINTANFSYRVTDGAEWSPVYNVTLNLTNATPVATAIDLETYYLVDISTMIVAQDADGDPLTYELLTAPSIGAASLTSDGLLTYAPTGNQSYNVVLSYRVNDGKAWSEPGEIQVNIVGPTVVDYSPVYVSYLSASAYAGVGSLDVDFTLTALGGSESFSFLWNFDDGVTSDLQSPGHTFANPGQYTVSVTITDNQDANNIAIAYLDILVLSPPTEIQVLLNTSNESDDTRNVDFNIDIDGGSAPYTVNIDYGDGQADETVVNESTFSVSHSYSDYGSYNVSVTVTSSDGVGITMLALANQRVVVSEPAQNPGTRPGSSNDSGGGGSIDFWFLLLGVLSLVYRYQGNRRV